MIKLTGLTLLNGCFVESLKRKKKEARRLSDEEIARRAKFSPKQPGNRQVTSNQLETSPWVTEHAKRRAKGMCQLCGQPAPFNDKAGAPFLETHHIVWLASGGEDSIENTVALCPNCHRMMHVLNVESDQDSLTRAAVLKTY